MGSRVDCVRRSPGDVCGRGGRHDRLRLFPRREMRHDFPLAPGEKQGELCRCFLRTVLFGGCPWSGQLLDPPALSRQSAVAPRRPARHSPRPRALRWSRHRRPRPQRLPRARGCWTSPKAGGPGPHGPGDLTGWGSCSSEEQVDKHAADTPGGQTVPPENCVRGAWSWQGPRGAGVQEGHPGGHSSRVLGKRKPELAFLGDTAESQVGREPRSGPWPSRGGGITVAVNGGPGAMGAGEGLC